jgi:hypothetical protein
MFTQSIIDAKRVSMYSIRPPPKAIDDCIAHLLNKMDHKKYAETVQTAIVRPSQKYTVVLFEYVHSGVNDTIAHVERLPGTTKSIHETINDLRCMSRLHDLFIVNASMRLYTRRKFDNTKPFHEQTTNIRQVVVTIGPYAFARPRVMSEESYEDMPDLVAYHE